MLCFLWGIDLALLTHLRGKHIVGVGVDLALCLMLVVLRRARAFHEAALLEMEARELSVQKQEVERLHEKLLKRTAQHDEVQKFWQFSTMNLLDLCEEYFTLIDTVYEDIISPTDDSTRRHITVIRELLVATVDGMGPGSLYMGHSSLEYNFLSAAAGQMKVSIGKFGKAVTSRDLHEAETCLGRLCCFLFVRVRSLNKKSVQDVKVVAHLCESLRRNKTQRQDLEDQESAGDNVQLTWQEKVYLPAPVGMDILILEVYGSTGVIGSVSLPFRGPPGTWETKHLNLHSRASKALDMKLKFDMFYGTSICQYAEVIRAA